MPRINDKRPGRERVRAVGVCDLGTFSALILIATLRRGQLVPLCEELRTVDLYRGAARPKTIGPSGLKRVLAVIAEFERLVEIHACDRAAIVATAGLRDAVNRRHVVSRLRSATDLPLRILSQRREAVLTAHGAYSGLPQRLKDLPVIDIGGGSTEILNPSTGLYRGCAIGAASASAAWAAIRRLPRDARPAAYRHLAAQEFARLRLPDEVQRQAVIGVGGTITTLAALTLRRHDYDPAAIHGLRLTPLQLSEWAERLSQLSEREIARLIPFDPGRARVLTAGTFLYEAVINRLCAPSVTVSVRGLRWGATMSLAGRHP